MHYFFNFFLFPNKGLATIVLSIFGSHGFRSHGFTTSRSGVMRFRRNIFLVKFVVC